MGDWKGQNGFGMLDNKKSLEAFDIYIKIKRITSVTVGLLKNKGMNLCLEPGDVGDVLNQYFASVFIKEKVVADSQISVENINMQDQFEIKKGKTLGFL